MRNYYDCNFDTIISSNVDFQENGRLEEVNLAYNGLGVEVSESLSQMLTANDTLRILNLCSTRLNDHAVSAVAFGLSKNDILESLNLSNNSFQAGGLCQLLEGMLRAKDSHLNHLEVSVSS